MAISPPSDIVLDVARAAEPNQLEAARARLASRAAAAASGLAEIFSVGDLRDPAITGAHAHDEATPAGYRNFEAMVLSTFVQELIPKHADAVYGEGLSGDMWKSLLAQQLGVVIADRGGIGIANHLLKDHYVEGDRKVALKGAAAGTEKLRHDQEHSLSSALVNELQRRLTADIAGSVSPSTSE